MTADSMMAANTMLRDGAMMMDGNMMTSNITMETGPIMMTVEALMIAIFEVDMGRVLTNGKTPTTPTAIDPGFFDWTAWLLLGHQ